MDNESSAPDQPTLHRAFHVNSHYRLQWEEAQQCHVLLYPEGMVRLSATATEILQRCLEPVTLSALVTRLCAAFADAPADVIAQDVEEFVADALQQGWLVDAG
ncbi:pyrroloquinoline quinone biosynthesis peptide chaperone PqqD [Ketobacter sp. MCCC 1A13808]|mgnify:CR=1 FL=1|uniref:pyrroloquinoline quinone biosynthesis peptide chaperone PqqD n=1 Tax=Ketobacter sp. MCCC 1A13808 TaxID=2602738 RepID=UPI000F0DDFF9|nr:pyrroloquinoline quinone biosynthesis peptide chaperone PqqD [Ketobacter sp. MCCC 1A13808]MVF13219.1 pyrroloquinoline quinone biosynthesis peptide chaperone PqqD [Ketobacter sp. MCCC 1A13808]RLP54216.1 MAG: pyrroloquinoline quinone biosynthesis peptide chaperone PqqD [Ketobacter sp.]